MMIKVNDIGSRSVGRRTFLKSGVLAGGAATLGFGIIGGNKPALGEQADNQRPLTKGDIAILSFLATAELIETDLWQQYAELGGNTSGAPNAYQSAFLNLDGDAMQYITSNTIDELSHATFINAYLESKGAEPVNLESARILQGSHATGAKNIGRLTDLMHLNVDTSWFTRYRSARNPDFGAAFPQAITIRDRTAIPRSDADFEDINHIQVIANTAAFHFGTIEQGGSSLYAALARKVSSEEVLKIVLGIGADEVAHFLEWVDFAGNAVQPPVAPVSYGGLTFPNFLTKGPSLQPNLIFPVPCEFISPSLPLCAALRPLNDKDAGARATVEFLISMNLFNGQPAESLTLLRDLGDLADAARREL